MTQLAPIPRRLVRVAVGPAGGGVARSFEEEDLEFNVKLTRRSKPNEAEVKIHNLSDYTIKVLEQPNQVLQILAGTDGLGQLFLGDISRRGVETLWDIPERITTIKAADGRRTYRDTTYSASFPAGTLLATVVQDLVVTSKLALGFQAPLPTVAFSSGWAYAGPWRAALAEVLLPHGYYYTIQAGTLYIYDEDGPPPPPTGAATVPLVSPTSGLIGSPQRTDKGVNFSSDLNAAFKPGLGVQVQSKFVNGLYRVATVDHSGSRDGSVWTSRVQAENIS